MKRNIRFSPSPAMRTFSRVFSGVFALIGLGFAYIGVTQVLPSGAGAFGIVWTLMACSFAGLGIYGVVSKNGLYGLYRGFGISITDEDAEGEKRDVTSRLEELEKLRDDGLVTKEEYDRKREEILKDL